MPTFIPLGRRVLIKRIAAPEKIGSLYIPDAAKDRPQEADVLAIGEGKDAEGRDVVDLITVKVGDRIYVPKYGGSDIKLDGEDLVVLNESEILGIIR